MAGTRYLKGELAVLKRLAEGPANKTDIKRALGWDPVSPSKALDALLASMRNARLVEPIAHGLWQIASDCEVCPHCQGRGILQRTA